MSNNIFHFDISFFCLEFEIMNYKFKFLVKLYMFNIFSGLIFDEHYKLFKG